MLLNRNVAGLSEGTTDFMTLKEMSWNVAGLQDDPADLFFVADFDAHSVGYFCCSRNVLKTLDGVNVGAHELFTPSELVERLQCPAVILHQRWNGEARSVG